MQEAPAAGAGLLVPLGQVKEKPKSAAAVAAQWFSQDLFGEEDGEGGEAAAEAPKDRLAVPRKVGTLLLPNVLLDVGCTDTHSRLAIQSPESSCVKHLQSTASK